MTNDLAEFWGMPHFCTPFRSLREIVERIWGTVSPISPAHRAWPSGTPHDQEMGFFALNSSFAMVDALQQEGYLDNITLETIRDFFPSERERRQKLDETFERHYEQRVLEHTHRHAPNEPTALESPTTRARL